MTTVKQIVKAVLDEMEGQTISDPKQYRNILEGKLTSRLNHLISGLKEEASHECYYPRGATTNNRCIVCGKIKN